MKITGFILLLALSSIWFKNYYFNHTKKVPKTANSIALWNVAKTEDLNLKQITKVLKNNTIETIFLVEALHNKIDSKTLSKAFKGYSFLKLNGNMLVASKGRIKPINYIVEAKNFKINHIEITLNNKTLSYILVDVYASPFHSKKEALNKIISYAEKQNIDIILGDFNTPFESVHFKNYSNQYQSFRSYQKGLTATWAFGIPLLEIDQIWLSKKYQVIKLKKLYKTTLDHALLVGYFSL